MAVIKPVQFPHVQRPTTVHKPRPVVPKNIEPTGRQRITQPRKAHPQTNVEINSARNVKSSKEEKLEVAIEVLRQKTAQFYGPKKNEVKKTTALGNYIDIKA